MAADGTRPSIRRVAEAAGVSVATVSNVLNGKSSVAPEIVGRVREAVQALGYVRDGRASRLRSGRSTLAGVIVPDLTNQMFASFVSTLEHAAREDGFDLVVVTSRNDPGEEAERLQKLREWRPAGVIVLPCDDAFCERIPPGLDVPVVVADRIPETCRFDLVAIQNAETAALVTGHLAEQGCRSCLVLGTSLSIGNVDERWQGCREGAGAMRLDLMEVGFRDHAPEALAHILRGPHRPDALFCLDHETALAAYRLARDIGLVIGRDIAFASFDEMEWMRLVEPPLTAVRQPVEEMSEFAWVTLKRRIDGEEAPSEARRLACAISFRGSTARRPASLEARSSKGG